MRNLSYTIDDLGIQPVQFGDEALPDAESSFFGGISPGSIGSGQVLSNLEQKAGTLYNGKTAFTNTDTGYRLGVDDSDGLVKFYIGNSSSFLNWTGTALNISGALTASTIDIGGADATSFHVDVDGNMWLGASTFAAAPAKISNAGAGTFSSMTITGGSVSGTPISSIPNNSSTDLSLLEKTWTMVFSSTDLNTVSWTSGTITLSNGRTFSISAGNTGNMAALTYIYLDPAVSSTVLQTTTTAATAMGANKALIGTAQNNSVTASFIPYGPGQPLVDGANIGALSVVANNIATATITAVKMNVSQLSGIAADLGTITAGTVTGATVQTASSGSRFVMTSTAFQGKNSGGDNIFEVVINGANAGDVTMGKVSSGKYAQWDDSAGTFTIFGATGAGNDVQTFNADGTWTKPTAGNYTYARVQAWGAGGSGARSVATDPASGGGGGEYCEKIYLLSALGSTESVIVGTGGAAVTSSSANGNDGEDTTFDDLTAAGGKGGKYTGDSVVAGGNGGDSISFGQPYSGNGSTESELDGIYSGAGGCSLSSESTTAQEGGKSIFGGAGGGGARTSDGANKAGGFSKNGGNGGASSITNGVNATAGTAPGGGGGAFHFNGGSGNSGAGANGRVVVTCF